MQLLCKPHLLYYQSHRSTTGSTSASEILHRSQSVQRWQWCNVIILLGKRRDTDQKRKLHKQDKMLHCLLPRHLLPLKRISVPEFPLLREKLQIQDNNTKQHLYLQQANSLVLNAQISASLGRIIIKIIILLYLTLAACLLRRGRSQVSSLPLLCCLVL